MLPLFSGKMAKAGEIASRGAGNTGSSSICRREEEKLTYRDHWHWCLPHGDDSTLSLPFAWTSRRGSRLYWGNISKLRAHYFCTLAQKIFIGHYLLTSAWQAYVRGKVPLDARKAQMRRERLRRMRRRAWAAQPERCHRSRAHRLGNSCCFQ
jgi:hypothetical protein